MATCSCALTDICTALAPGTDKQLTPSRTQLTVRVVDSHRPRWLSGAYSGEILLVVLAFVALIDVRRNPVLVQTARSPAMLSVTALQCMTKCRRLMKQTCIDIEVSGFGC